MRITDLPENLQKQVFKKYLEQESKYHNKKTNGFDSKHEAERYAALKLLERSGIISDVRCQVKFELIPKTDKFRSTSYIADFVYFKDGVQVVEDAKGVKTEVYKIKKKLMYYKYAIEVIEV